MKPITPILTFLLLSSICFGQDFGSEFLKYCLEGDESKQLKILEKWEKADPNNPELFTSYFNYYFSQSRQEFVSLTTDQPDGESLSLQDSTGKTAGFLGSQISYNQETLKKAFDKIEQGIKLYPNRLDMRFGKIYAQGQLEDWENFTDEIVRTIRYSSENKNQWVWTNNEKKKDGKEILLSSLQDYQLSLYNTGDDKLLINMRTIAEEILKYYPNHVASLSNLSITYLLTGEYEKGIEPLLRAEKLDPTDAIVLSNIAQGYKLKGEKEKAIQYYKKAIKHGDEQTAAYSRQQIAELEK